MRQRLLLLSAGAAAGSREGMASVNSETSGCNGGGELHEKSGLVPSGLLRKRPQVLAVSAQRASKRVSLLKTDIFRELGALPPSS